MDLEHSHLVCFGKNMTAANELPTDPDADNATSEQVFDVEADNTKSVLSANLEFPVDVDNKVMADKTVYCATAEYLLESLGDAVGIESSPDISGISCEIVGDLKVYVSPTFSQLLTVQSAETLNHDPEFSPHHSLTLDATSTADDVMGFCSLFNVNAELQDVESEKILPCDADASTVKTEFKLSLTDDVSQLQDAFGTDIDDLLVMKSDAQMSAIRESDNTVVLYDTDDRSDDPTNVPDPYPCSFNKHNSHMWDRDYARMPYAVDNWHRIVMVLNRLSYSIQSLKAVEDAIKQYIECPEAIDFGGLKDYFCEKDAGDTLLSRTCLLDLIAKIAKLAVDLPNVCTRPIRLLRQQKNFMVAMSQYQAACLLANAFFCTFPPPASCHLRDFSFMGLFRKSSSDRRHSQHAKLDCIFNYFRQVATNLPTGILTFRRQVGQLVSLWSLL